MGRFFRGRLRGRLLTRFLFRFFDRRFPVKDLPAWVKHAISLGLGLLLMWLAQNGIVPAKPPISLTVQVSDPAAAAAVIDAARK